MRIGIKPHWQHFWTLLRHKWFVFLECRRTGIFWQGVTHDLSKFSRAEWMPYVRHFYCRPYPKLPDALRQCPAYSGPTKESVKADFDLAWLHHQKYNKHHWQWWLLIQDKDEDKVLPMPHRYRREMLADWIGAGKAYGRDDTTTWYFAHREKMKLHPATRQWIEEQLKEMK